jgi:hypothetical protein
MHKPTIFGWLMIVSGVATVVLAFVFPFAALVTGIIFALLLLGVVSEGMSGDLLIGNENLMNVIDERKREALSRRFKRGRPEWETTPPDHADEHPDAVWERERKRRGLG